VEVVAVRGLAKLELRGSETQDLVGMLSRSVLAEEVEGALVDVVEAAG
jgi:hypothetical protein